MGTKVRFLQIRLDGKPDDPLFNLINPLYIPNIGERVDYQGKTFTVTDVIFNYQPPQSESDAEIEVYLSKE